MAKVSPWSLAVSLAVDGRHHGDVPVRLGHVEAAGVPGMHPGHRQVARREDVALVELVAVRVIGIRHEVFVPDAIIVPLPGLVPGERDDRRLGLRVIRYPAVEERADAAGIRPLLIETELGDVLRVEIRAGGVVAVLVHGQLLRQFGEGSQVPGLAIVRFTDLVGRVGQLGFIEQFLVVDR